MRIQVEISLYPLGVIDVGEVVTTFIQKLDRSGMDVFPGNMSTVIGGDLDEVFATVKAAFEHVGTSHGAAMVLKVSNACPWPSTDSVDS